MEKVIVFMLLMILTYQDLRNKEISMILVAVIAAVNAIDVIASGELYDRMAFILLCMTTFIIAGFLFRKYVGVGDIALLSSLAINMSLNDMISVIAISSIALSLVGVLLLIFKKMNVKDELPYVPFLTVSIFLLFFRSCL